MRDCVVMSRNKSANWTVLLILLAFMVAMFSPILFTSKIVRAPDILNEFYWGVYNSYGKPLWSMLRINLASAGWDPYINSGHSNDGGMASMQFLYLYRLVFGIIPAPASVAWFMVLHLFIGGAGTYMYCRLTGCSRWAAFLGGIIFAFCTENVSLINAGHVMKIATIAHAPWVFYFLEKGFRSGRLFHYLTAGLVLAFQFYNTHWQIAFYTCLGIAAYVLIRLLSGIFNDEGMRDSGRVLLMSVVMTLFFLAASAISLAPLAGWSKDTNRGVHSGANQGKGGLDREEAMMWSMPPEEAVALAVPGIFGLSRQEAGDRPSEGQVYYWGRMVFTQTASYFGLLPWLLLPLPMMFRNDRITKTALVALIGGILFSMGKYTPVYELLYDYLPGISRFRVPKMMLFITSLGLAVLSARGADILRDETILRSERLRKWFIWVCAFPLSLVLVLLVEKQFGPEIRSWMFDLLSRPTRYESGIELVARRWLNVERETGIALAFASLYALLLLAMARRKIPGLFCMLALLAVLSADLWRVNSYFMVLTDPPRLQSAVSPAMAWIKEQQSKTSFSVPPDRVLLLGSTDSMRYAAARIPVLFTSNAVQKRRWQEYLDAFSLQSYLPGLMNVRWLVYDQKLYDRDVSYFGGQYQVVFTGGGEVVLENLHRLPKAWLVNTVQNEGSSTKRLNLLRSSSFDLTRVAVVESTPPISVGGASEAGETRINRLEAEKIELLANAVSNSLLVLAEKYHKGWYAYVDGKPAEIVPVNHILRGVYLTPGKHMVEFRFDPLPFKIGKFLTIGSFGLFCFVAVREWLQRRRKHV